MMDMVLWRDLLILLLSQAYRAFWPPSSTPRSVLEWVSLIVHKHGYHHHRT